MRYVIIDSGDAEELGTIEIDANTRGDNEMIIETLIAGDYLEGEAADYEITEGDFFSEAGSLCVRDEDGPVLSLEPEAGDDEDADFDDEDDDDGYDDEDDDDDDDDDDSTQEDDDDE